jgi:hypothetical protein
VPSPLLLTNSCGDQLGSVGLCCFILAWNLTTHFSGRRILTEVTKNIVVANFVTSSLILICFILRIRPVSFFWGGRGEGTLVFCQNCVARRKYSGFVK